MKKWMLAVSPVALGLLGNVGYAEEMPSIQGTEEAQTMPLITEIPTDERAFVDVIHHFNKQKIVELWGEPTKADDVRVKSTGRVVASIWHYHFVNTDAHGTYYPTTELDFIEDKVVQVVFLNNDGSEENDGDGIKYELQPLPEMEKLEEIPATD